MSVIATIRRSSESSGRKSTVGSDEDSAMVLFVNMQWLASSLIIRTYHVTPKRTMYLLCSWMGQLQLTILTQELNYKKGKYLHLLNTLHKKWSLPLRISSVNVTKSNYQSHFARPGPRGREKNNFLFSHFLVASKSFMQALNAFI